MLIQNNIDDTTLFSANYVQFGTYKICLILCHNYIKDHFYLAPIAFIIMQCCLIICRLDTDHTNINSSVKGNFG